MLAAHWQNRCDFNTLVNPCFVNAPKSDTILHATHALETLCRATERDLRGTSQNFNTTLCKKLDSISDSVDSVCLEAHAKHPRTQYSEVSLPHAPVSISTTQSSSMLPLVKPPYKHCGDKSKENFSQVAHVVAAHTPAETNDMEDQPRVVAGNTANTPAATYHVNDQPQVAHAVAGNTPAATNGMDGQPQLAHAVAGNTTAATNHMNDQPQMAHAVAANTTAETNHMDDQPQAFASVASTVTRAHFCDDELTHQVDGTDNSAKTKTATPQGTSLKCQNVNESVTDVKEAPHKVERPLAHTCGREFGCSACKAYWKAAYDNEKWWREYFREQRDEVLQKVK